jgi:hypothetical protein
MKRRMIHAAVAAFILSATPFAWADGATSGSGFTLEMGVSPQVGVLFGGTPDIALSGAALQVALGWSGGILHAEAGIEAGESPLGWQILAPLRAGFGFARHPFDFELLLEAAPGAALFQQAPLFLVGFGAILKAAWNVTPRFALYLAPGARWTMCPAYLLVDGASYTSLDIPLTLGMRFSF